MSKAVVFSLLFLFISCHHSAIKSGKIQKREHVIIESIIKARNVNGARASLDIYRDSLKLKLRLPILPIDILELKIDNSNIFIKQIGKAQDTIETSAISSHIKLSHLKKLILKKKRPTKPIRYNHKSIFISHGDAKQSFIDKMGKYRLVWLAYVITPSNRPQNRSGLTSTVRLS